jgi:hypothetical protein
LISAKLIPPVNHLQDRNLPGTSSEWICMDMQTSYRTQFFISYPVNSSLKGMKMQSKASLSVDKAIPAD